MGTRQVQYPKQHELMMSMKTSWPVAFPLKKVIIYAVIYIISALLIAYLFWGNIEMGLSTSEKKTLYVVSMLLIGASHIFLFPKWLADIYNKDDKKLFLYSFLLAVLSGLLIFSLLALAGFSMHQMAFAGALSFLLPSAVVQSWKYFDSLAGSQFPVWYLPATAPPQKQATIFLNSLQLNIRVKENYFDIDEGSYVVTVPGRLPVGVMFHQFLLEQQGVGVKFELTDQQQRPYGWRFTLQRRLNSRPLDAEQALSDSRVSQHDTVLAERIKTN